MSADLWERLGVEAGLKHYIEVRNRLQRPPNAVADDGIDLYRRKVFPEPPPSETAKLPSISDRIAEIVSSYPPLPKKLTINTITDCVAESFGLAPAEIRLPSRRPKYVFPRHVAIYLSRRLTKRSLPEIALAFHHADHTTVVNAIKKVGIRLQVNIDLAAKVEAIEVSLRAKYADRC